MRKSLVLLFGRLLITLLFLYVGWVQIYRVMQRDWALWSKLEYDSMWRRDGHVSIGALSGFLIHPASGLLAACSTDGTGLAGAHHLKHVSCATAVTQLDGASTQVSTQRH